MGEPRKIGRLTSFLRSSAPGECPSGAKSSATTDVWEKWHIGSLYAFYALLGTATVISYATGGGMSAEERISATGLAVLLCGWHYLAAHRRMDAIYANPPAIIVYFIVTLALLAALIRLDPDYNVMAFIIFWLNFSLWRLRYAIPGAFVGSLYMSWVNSDTANLLDIISSPEMIGYLFISVPISIALGLFITSIIRQSHERRRLIEELEATRKTLAEKERRAGILEERGRLAKEIHDTLAQGFISIVTHLEAAEEEGDDVSPETIRHLEQAKRTARENLVEARRLVAALRPEILESSSLPEALRRLAARWSDASGVSCEVNVFGDEVRLDQDLQITLLRAAQESLSNIRRHADAKHASISLSYAGDLALLDVNDDGRGFDPNSSPNSSPNGDGGFGLTSMRERVESLGGRLLIESEPGEGATVAVQLPIKVKQISEAK